MGLRGPIPYEPNEEDRLYVREKAARGATMGSIARRLGLGVRAVREHYLDEFKAGIEEANEEVAGKLFADCMREGHQYQASRFFWLKTQAGWREKNRLELTGRNGGPVETLDLSKLSDDELAKILPILEKLAAGGDDPGDSEGGEGGEDEAE